jgi:hypothetical protein
VISLDPTQLNGDFGRVAQEVIQHLTSLMGTDVEVTVEIHATNSDGSRTPVSTPSPRTPALPLRQPKVRRGVAQATFGGEQAGAQPDDGCRQRSCLRS